jgi:hypothetical protein
MARMAAVHVGGSDALVQIDEYSGTSFLVGSKKVKNHT